jgi:hypothetical protein
MGSPALREESGANLPDARESQFGDLAPAGQSPTVSIAIRRVL